MKKMLLLFILFPILTFGQSEKEIDSLKRVISSEKLAIDKIQSYKKLIEFYLATGSNESSKYIDDLNRLNNNELCPKCEGLYYYYKSIKNNISGGNPAETLQNLDKSIAISKLIKDEDDLFYTAVYEKIDVLIAIKNYEEAQTLLVSTEQYFKKTKNEFFLNNIYSQYAHFYQKQGYNNLAIDMYFKVYTYYLKNKKEDIDSRIHLLAEISLLYLDLNKMKKATEYIDLAVELTKKSKSQIQIIGTKYKKGTIEYRKKNYKNSLKFFNEIFVPLEKTENVVYKCATASFIARNYIALKNYKMAAYYTSIAVEGFKNANNPPYLSLSLLNRARISLANGDYINAKKDIDTCKIIMKDLKDSNDYLNIFDAEIDFFKATNQYKEALDDFQIRDSLQKVLDDKTNLNNINEVETKYQTQKKEAQIKLLSTQNELAKKQKYIYIGLLALLAIIGGSLFYGYRNKIKTAQKLHELNTLKSRFFANISHEFRTPLTLIKSPIQSLTASKIDDNQQNQLQLIDKNANRMLELVDQLLELSKIDSGHLKLIFKDGNISSFLTSIMEPFNFQAKEKGINFTASIGKSAENNSFDKDVIEKIVSNLVSNAFKYTPSNESITFTSSVENSNLTVIVANTGSELQKDDLPKLFERFYQQNENQQGAGIGLALVKELVDLYQGTLSAKLENGQLLFTVTLPLAQSNENAIVIPFKETVSTIENTTSSDSELPVLLIIDDNTEIRNVIKDIFKKEYQIIEAQDGEEALQLAQSAIPDCIISDVMMPKLDGFEFTKQVKSNELTSFIPIVLLTAKTSDEAHVEGLKSTADVFLTKPFNNEVLKQTVYQLIAERKKLHTRYSQELVLKPVDIVINSVEEKFIEKLQTILDKNLSNSEYSAEDFAAEIGVSRMQLHRKLKSLLGVSATEFLRQERLKIGAELLKQSNGNISEVAYAVGFNDLSYFSKCFKEMYHCSPTEYIEKNKTT